MEMEDYRAKSAMYYRKFKDIEKELKTTMIEQKFLARKYIAFLIHKGWTKVRQEEAARRIAENNY